MVHETPELYQSVVKPYIDAFPPARTQWFATIPGIIINMSYPTR